MEKPESGAPHFLCESLGSALGPRVAPNEAVGGGGLSSKPVCGVDKWPRGSRQASLPPNLGRIRKTPDYWSNSPRQGAGARINRRAPGTKKGEADAR